MICQKTCAFCGQEFTAKSGAEKSCSPACHRRRKNENLRRYRARHRHRLGWKNMTPEQKEKLRARLRAWRRNNPDKARAQWVRSVQKNIEKYRERARRDYWRDPEKHKRASVERYRRRRTLDPVGFRQRELAHRLKYRDRINQRQRENVAQLKDSYIRALLNNSKKIPGRQWPEPVVKFYATILKIKRAFKNINNNQLNQLCQNQKTSTNCATNCLTPLNP